MALQPILEGMTGQQAADLILANDNEVNTAIGVRTGAIEINARNNQFFDKSNYIAGQFINTGTGAITASGADWRTALIPFKFGETQINVSGLVNISGKAYRFENAAGALISWAAFTAVSQTIAWPAGATQFRFTYKRDTDAVTAGNTVMVNYGAAPLPLATFEGVFITKINGIAVDGTVSVAPLIPSIVPDTTVNLFNKDYINPAAFTSSGVMKDYYIQSGGNVVKLPEGPSAAGWATARIPKPAGATDITLSGLIMLTGKYWRTVDKNGNMVTFSGSTQYATPVFTLAWPVGAVALEINIVRTGVSEDEALNGLMANSGVAALPYAPFTGFISQINGVPLIGNSTDDVVAVEVDAWGDSTTEGADLVNPTVERWTTLLATALGVTVNNYGKSGARSEEITMLLGGIYADATVNTGDLTGGVNRALTYISTNPFRSTSGLALVSAIAVLPNGSIIAGTLQGTGFTALAGTPSTDVTGQVIRFYSILGRDSFNKNIVLLGQGINNEGQINAGEMTVQDVCNLYTSATAQIKNNFFVWGMLDRGPTEAVGTPNGNIIAAVELFLTERYGNKYLPLRKYLASPQALADAVIYSSGFVPTSDDLAAQAVGTVPPSFRSPSSVHLNVLGHKLQANYFYKALKYYIF